jgi:hypothetical protein
MAKYFFDLGGLIPAQDLVGQECADDKGARKHGDFIAHRIGTERPEMVREENYIAVLDGQRRELFRIPLASTTV